VNGPGPDSAARGDVAGAAARASVLNNPETVLAEHLKIEARMAPAIRRRLLRPQQTHDTFLKFKEWLAEREEPRIVRAPPRRHTRVARPVPSGCRRFVSGSPSKKHVRRNAPEERGLLVDRAHASWLRMRH